MANRYYQGLSAFHCYAMRVPTTSIRLWVGTLEQDTPRPEKAQVRLFNNSRSSVFGICSHAISSCLSPGAVSLRLSRKTLIRACLTTMDPLGGGTSK